MFVSLKHRIAFIVDSHERTNRTCPYHCSVIPITEQRKSCTHSPAHSACRPLASRARHRASAESILSTVKCSLCLAWCVVCLPILMPHASCHSRTRICVLCRLIIIIFASLLIFAVFVSFSACSPIRSILLFSFRIPEDFWEFGAAT